MISSNWLMHTTNQKNKNKSGYSVQTVACAKRAIKATQKSVLIHFITPPLLTVTL